uniref:DUF7745 domain-containing protein n=1 Tax=Fagus sylvatica TaxID=28930 RepID=A0A2N9GX87_FAGSY
MASSSGGPSPLVALHFHDFRAERMQHWWDLLEGDDRASIKSTFGKFSSLMWLHVDHGLLEALTSFWDPSHCCFSIGEMDLVPTLEEYAELLQLGSPFSDTPFVPSSNLRSNRALEKCLGLTSEPRLGTASGQCLQDRLRRGWGKGVPMFCVQFLQLWFCSHLRHFYLRQTPYYLTRRIVRQTVDISLPFTDTGDEWASYLLDLPLSKWSWRVTWGPAVWKLWTHCSRFGGMPLLGMWGCTDYYPGLALRQFGGLQYLPRLGDLSLVTFDYVSGGDMWKLLSLAKDIWVGRCSEMVFVEDGLSADSSVTTEFVEWREGWSPSFTPRPTIWPGVSHSSVPPSLRVSATTGQSERVTDLERELEEARAELATLRLARASEREESTAHVESMRSTLHHSNMAVANLRRDLEAQRGNVSALRAMNDFTCEQLEISEGAKDHLEEALAEAQGQLEAEQGTSSGLLEWWTLWVLGPALSWRSTMREDLALSTALGRFCMRDLHTSWSLVSISSW